MLDAGWWMLNVGYLVLAIEWLPIIDVCGTLTARCWLMDTECGVLTVGC